MCAETLEIMGLESGAIVGTDAAWEWRGHTGEVRCAACGRDTRGLGYATWEPTGPDGLRCAYCTMECMGRVLAAMRYGRRGRRWLAWDCVTEDGLWAHPEDFGRAW